MHEAKFALQHILGMINSDDSIAEVAEMLRQVSKDSAFFNAIALYILLNERVKCMSDDMQKALAAELNRLTQSH